MMRQPTADSAVAMSDDCRLPHFRIISTLYACLAVLLACAAAPAADSMALPMNW